MSRRPPHGVYPEPQTLEEALAVINRVWSLLPRWDGQPHSDLYTIQLRGALDGRTR